MRNIQIVDTTLRDGLQAPGVAITRRAKIEIANRLDRIGVQEMEIGTPAMGKTACDDIRAIERLGLAARLSVWCRARRDDLAAAAECGVEGVHISFPISDILLAVFRKDRIWLKRTMNELLPDACRRFSRVTVGAQDATRTPLDKLMDFAAHAGGFGIDRLRIADTVGICRPLQVDQTIDALRCYVPHLPLEFHAHNDLGMATANAVTAAEAGADAVSVTINGIGERSGNAPLEEIVMALAGVDTMTCTVMPYTLTSLCQRVAKMTGRSIPAAKPITGVAAFMHESAIHLAGLRRSPLAYQPFLPQTVGWTGAQFFNTTSGNPRQPPATQRSTASIRLPLSNRAGIID
ncbi:MAG: hypothetical protein SWH68_02560 [Thermodesulfobacteriota bacterium]|nr:hypothetical protein [Thermodesulfobacteriota bacterium]